jgi:hypothetical protein
MIAIRIETTIDSETLHLPQLRPLLGKNVEITIRERVAPMVTEGSSDWGTVEAAALELEDYDFQAYREARAAELRETE